MLKIILSTDNCGTAGLLITTYAFRSISLHCKECQWDTVHHQRNGQFHIRICVFKLILPSQIVQRNTPWLIETAVPRRGATQQFLKINVRFVVFHRDTHTILVVNVEFGSVAMDFTHGIVRGKSYRHDGSTLQ